MASFLSGALPAFEPLHESPLAPAAGASSSKTEQLRPTEGVQIQQLRASGQSLNEIATSLGVPLAQVDSDLGISSQPAATPLTTISIKA